MNSEQETGLAVWVFVMTIIAIALIVAEWALKQ